MRSVGDAAARGAYLGVGLRLLADRRLCHPPAMGPVHVTELQFELPLTHSCGTQGSMAQPTDESAQRAAALALALARELETIRAEMELAASSIGTWLEQLPAGHAASARNFA